MFTPITPRLRGVGVTDTAIDLFEGQYPVPHGITYNSYLLTGQSSAALVDSVDAAFTDEWFANVDEAVEASGGREPEWLVIHHMEPDHSGSIARAMERWPSMKIAAGPKAIAMMPQFFDEAASWGARMVAFREGDELDLGGGTVLRFLAAPMVHWPEVMVSFETGEGTLFSADAFGTFGAPGTDGGDWTPEAARYYVNICGKYGAQVQSLLKKVAPLGVNRVCALHGPVLEGAMIQRAVELYDLWSRYEPDLDSVFVAYASIYGNTAGAAAALALALEERGVGARVLDLARCDLSEAVALAFRCRSMVLCASTYDGSVFPPMADFLHHLSLKGLRGRKVGLIQNGSWAPVAASCMTKRLEAMKEMTVVEPVVTLLTRLTPGSEAEIALLADSMAAEC